MMASNKKIFNVTEMDLDDFARSLNNIVTLVRVLYIQ